MNLPEVSWLSYISEEFSTLDFQSRRYVRREVIKLFDNPSGFSKSLNPSAFAEAVGLEIQKAPSNRVKHLAMAVIDILRAGETLH